MQIEQDRAVCAQRYPDLICRPIAAQFMEHNLIALFELTLVNGEIAVSSELHYRLVLTDELSAEELQQYRNSRIPIE